MKDLQGRVIDYMRISITDRCNLRCKYCMPHGVECVPRWDILTLEEIQAIAICAAGLGIRHIKVTGGEPLVRKDCCQLVKMLKDTPGIEKVTITTNGVLLDRYLDDLVKAGIDGINISLDTLDQELYRRITGADALGSVIAVIKRASELPVSVKINAVSIDFTQMAQEEEDGSGVQGQADRFRLTPRISSPAQPLWRQMVELARDYPVDVRFIEMMPIGYGKNFKTINHKDLLEEMKTAYPSMEEDGSVHGFGPAVYYRIPGFKGSVGLISAIHGKFCSDCNRVRLTSQGYLKPCLCYEDGADLRKILRNGQERPQEECHYRWPLAACPSNEGLQRELRKTMEQVIAAKPAAHCFERPGQITEAHNMIAIGG